MKKIFSGFWFESAQKLSTYHSKPWKNSNEVCMRKIKPDFVSVFLSVKLKNYIFFGAIHSWARCFALFNGYMCEPPNGRTISSKFKLRGCSNEISCFNFPLWPSRESRNGRYIPPVTHESLIHFSVFPSTFRSREFIVFTGFFHLYFFASFSFDVCNVVNVADANL
jgi:hypothetical protein